MRRLIEETVSNVNTTVGGARRVAVVGGGISGLAAAHRLVELDPSCHVVLFEAGNRLGGVLETVHEEGYEVERSADNFITTIPYAVDLCRRLGLAESLVQTNPQFRQTYVVRRGRLHKLPDGFMMMAPTRLWPLALTPILSPWGKMRAGLEYFIPPRRDDGDESMAAFVRRRLGREVFDRLVEPLVSAVYAADMERLSVKATLSRFREMEREHGSLIRAMRTQMARRRHGGESGARYSMFVTLRGGLSRLVAALADRLPPGAVRFNAAVERIERREPGSKAPAREGPEEAALAEDRAAGNGGWNVRLADGAAETFDAVIVTAPSFVAADLLRGVDAPLADALAAIEHSGTAIVSVAYEREQVGHPISGMGAVVPKTENSPVLAVSFSSQKYTHRAPEGKVLLRVFAGGARRPELAGTPAADLVPPVLAELSRLLAIRGEPCYTSVANWPRTMPQYTVGHRDRVARLEERLAGLPGIFLAGNAYRGVGIPDCIHGGETAAQRALGG